MSEERLGFLLTDVHRLLRRSFQLRMEQSGGPTLAQSRALIYLSRNQGMRQVQLAELLEVKPITLTRLLDQLAEAGLIERRIAANDRRAFELYLTDQAAPHLNRIERTSEAISQQALHGLTEQQAQQLRETLRLIQRNLTPDPILPQRNPR